MRLEARIGRILKFFEPFCCFNAYLAYALLKEKSLKQKFEQN